MSSRSSELRLLTAAAFAAALLPRLAHRGQFLDGITDAAIARNLAEGRGSFWEPSYTATLYPVFHEHPPLAFWLQSLFFRVLGDQWYVERIYCAFAAAATALLIAWSWRAAYGGDPPGTSATGSEATADALGWLPVLLWIVVPVVSWTIVSNMLEATVAVFTAAAVTLVAAGTAGSRAAAAAGVASGVCVACAVLSKGPVGLFPLAAPLLLAVVGNHRRHAVRCSLAQLGTVLAIAVLVSASPMARASVGRYFADQVVASLAGRREVSGSQFTILGALIVGVWLPMAVASALVLLGAGRAAPPAKTDRQLAIAFTAIGLAGTLPILASPKQSGHYMMPAVAFLALGAAAALRPSAQRLSERAARGRARWVMTGGTVALIVTALSGVVVPAFERDPELLAELDRLEPLLPRDETIGVCPAANGDWILHAWFQRRWRVSLDASASPHAWFLKVGPDAPDCPPLGCRPAAPDGRHALQLMKCERR